MMDYEQFKLGSLQRRRYFIVYLLGFTSGFIIPQKYFINLMNKYYDYLYKNTFAYRKNKYYASFK